MSGTNHDANHGGHGDLSAVYRKVVITLLSLTVLTVLVSYMPLGVGGGIFVGLVIAVVKASLVALYFMHLKFEIRSTYVLVGVPLALLLLLMFALMPDIANVAG
ncbi:MAG: cytochrome C oxidase subunit IV family protein [Planctomycetota bacterium]